MTTNPILTRFSEPSTYAGIAAIIGAAGFVVPHGIFQDVAFAGMAVAGAVAVVLKEGWKKALESGDLATAVATAATDAAAPKP